MRLDPDRLLPTDPATRGVARRLYERVAELPIISPHGHVDPGLLLHNLPFGDPAELLIRRDHYITRLIHAAGVPLERHGLVRHVHLGHGPGLYALVGHGEQEYIYCPGCRTARTVRPELLDPVRNHIRRRFGYEVRFTHFALVGRCARCAPADGA